MSEHDPAEGRRSEFVEVMMGTRRYRLRGADPALLRGLAAKVDVTLDEIAGPAGNKEDFKVAVLAALNLAAGHEEERAAWVADARVAERDLAEAEARLASIAERL